MRNLTPPCASCLSTSTGVVSLEVRGGNVYYCRKCLAEKVEAADTYANDQTALVSLCKILEKASDLYNRRAKHLATDYADGYYDGRHEGYSSSIGALKARGLYRNDPQQ